MTTYYQKHKAVIIKRQKIYYRKNRQKIHEKQAKTYAALTTKEKKRRGRMARFCALLRLYNVSEFRYRELLKEQENKCACCGKRFTKRFEQRPCVDHSHSCCSGERSCGKCVRALICRWCNRLVGIIEKNTCLLAYLNLDGGNNGITK